VVAVQGIMILTVSIDEKGGTCCSLLHKMLRWGTKQILKT